MKRASAKKAVSQKKQAEKKADKKVRNKAKDTPLSEITLRKYEKPYKMSKRECVKKLCLSIGLLQPGDSRDIIVDILHILLMHRKGLYFGRIEELLIKKRKRHKLSQLGVTKPNIHRQLRRLKDSMLIEKHQNLYRLTEKMSPIEIFENRIVKYYISSVTERIGEYFRKLS